MVHCNYFPLLVVLIVIGFWFGATAVVCALAGSFATFPIGFAFDKWLQKVSK